MSEDTRAVIAAAVESSRQDTPADGGPEISSEVETSDPAISDVPEPAIEAASEPDLDDLPAPKPVEKTPEQVKAEEEAAAAKKAQEDDPDFAKEPEFVTERGKQKENRIPHSRVKKMVESEAKRVKAAVEAEYAPKLQQYEGKLREMDQLGEIMERDPERFMQMLANANPTYREFVRGQASAAGAAPPASANDPMPKPDAQLADGTPAYSPEQFEKVQEWNARQVENRVLGKVNEQFKWVNDAKAAQDAIEAAKPQIRAQIQDAGDNWPGFKENYDAILAELRADSASGHPKLTLHDAYRKVILSKRDEESTSLKAEIEKLKIDRNKMREELLAELKGSARSTATTGTTPVPRPDQADTPKDSRSIIADTVARLKGRSAA